MREGVSNMILKQDLQQTVVDVRRSAIIPALQRIIEAYEKAAQVVNTLRSGRIWPANVEHCPQSWTLGQTFLEKLLLIWLLSSMFCK
jgi:hypothetical protein